MNPTYIWLGLISKKLIIKMLKKFTDFTNEKKISNSDISNNDFPKKSNKDIKVQETSTTSNVLKETNMENFDFVGKIVKFPSNIKPSVSIVMLENNNISKEKLHFIISKQTKNSLVIIKYNEKSEIKLNDFINTIFDYYKKNNNEIFEKIIVEGNNSFSIIKNIPEIKIGEKLLIEKLNDDIIKLLK